MKKINLKYFLLGLTVVTGVTLYACRQEFLEVNPRGALDENILATEAGVQRLLIGAYSMVDGVSDNTSGWEGAASNWVFGSIAGAEANKGSDAGDQPDINTIQAYTADGSNGFFNAKWRVVYDGVARSNSVLRVLAKVQDINETTRTNIAGQARALRGHFHFEAKRNFGNVPYIDEETNDYYVPNDKDIWPEIEADLKFAYDNLPANLVDVGRINKWVAGAMYAKALIYQGKYTLAKPIVEAIIAEGVKPNGVKFALMPSFDQIFDAVNGNAAESVFAWQYSVNDGSGGWNGGWGEVLNFPHEGGPGACCGFFQPTQSFVNAFRTTSTGLPLLDGSYNTPANAVVNDQGLTSAQPFTPDAGPLDPRLDHSVGRRGIPYLDWGLHPGRNWIRDQGYAGPYSPKKQVYRQSQEGQLTEVGNWTSGWTANNYQYIRFAEVILWAAEIEIEVGSLEQARTYINQIRNRAKNSNYVTLPGGAPAANYVIEPYTNPFASQDEARLALRHERLLELGMEGHRFYDLVRWGIAKQYIDNFLAYERPLRPDVYTGNNNFAPHRVVYPIPLRQIDLMRGALKQNTGY